MLNVTNPLLLTEPQKEKFLDLIALSSFSGTCSFEATTLSDTRIYANTEFINKNQVVLIV